MAAFRFELTRVQVQAVRERVLALLVNVAPELAQAVASGMGITAPPALPKATSMDFVPEVEVSAALSLFARPGDGSVTGKRVALLVCEGIEGESLRVAREALLVAGAAPRFIGSRLGAVTTREGDTIHVEITTETAPSVLWDAVVLPAGEEVFPHLASLGQVKEFIKDQYRHCKPMLALGTSSDLLETMGIPTTLATGAPDEAISSPAADSAEIADAADLDSVIQTFIANLGRHRYFLRETDPPMV